MRVPHVALLLATVCLVAGSESRKRTPSGFTGVRGKKAVGGDDGAYAMDARRRPFDGWTADVGGEEERAAAADYGKRAPNGFLGVRGKKEVFARAGFHGVRGKKDGESTSAADAPKRAPTSGFFGVRGKKEPTRAGFFGMRGKKYPYEFRGKFVGVRGKKADASADGEGPDFGRLMLLLAENAPHNHPADVYQYLNSITN